MGMRSPQGAMKLISSPSSPAQATKSLDDSTPRHRPATSTTGAPLMSERKSMRAASRRDVLSGMVITGVVIRSAAVKASSDLAAWRVGAVRMAKFLQEGASVRGTGYYLGLEQSACPPLLHDLTAKAGE